MEGEASSAFNMSTTGFDEFEDLQAIMVELLGQNPYRNQHGLVVQTENHEVQHLQTSNMQERDEYSVTFNRRCDKGKDLVSKDDDLRREKKSISRTEISEDRRVCQWQRVKWTEAMVKMLITAVSYFKELSYVSTGGGIRKGSLQKFGKWNCVSKVMTERGYCVSPPQCEDKFNDLSRKYKKLNDLLGRGTSCMVVENPKLLDGMDIDEKLKVEVRRILGSKCLCYEQMCSYHNRNRLFLPHDRDLLRSLEPYFRGKDGRCLIDKLKRPIHEQDRERGGQKNDCNVVLGDQIQAGIVNEDVCGRGFLIEQKKLEMKGRKLKLEKMHVRKQTISLKQEKELEKLRLENECLKLGNERLASELKRKAATSENGANKKSRRSVSSVTGNEQTE